MLAKITFILYLWSGTIIPQGDNEGRPLYNVNIKNGTPCIELAYRGEILDWIKQGEPESFQYDESLED